VVEFQQGIDGYGRKEFDTRMVLRRQWSQLMIGVVEDRQENSPTTLQIYDVVQRLCDWQSTKISEKE